MSYPKEITRVLPHDQEAEVCVLGSMMLEPLCIPVVRQLVAADDFFMPAHRLLFEFLCRLTDENKPIDLVTLNAEFKRTKLLDRVGGTDYLVKLVEGVPSALHVEHYSRTVLDRSRARKMIAGMTQVIHDLYESTDQIENTLARAAVLASDLARPVGNTRSAIEVMDERTEDVFAGRRATVQTEWKVINEKARPFVPGAVTMLSGSQGSTKSFMLQQAMLSLDEAGVPCSVLLLEKDSGYQLKRALAQLAHDGRLTSDEWERANEVEARGIRLQWEDRLLQYQKCLHHTRRATRSWITQWISARASEGNRIIAVDPISHAVPEKDVWIKDDELVDSCLEIAGRYGCSIVMVTHPRDNDSAAKPGAYNMKGGKAYSQFTDCNLVLQLHKPPITSEVKTAFGNMAQEHNRTLFLAKTRDGVGQGLSIAMEFDPQTLHIRELGMIVPKAKKGERQ